MKTSLVRSSSERFSKAHREPLRRLVRGVAVAIGISLFMPSAHAPALEMTAKEYASVQMNKTQYKCLASLWGKESAWNPNAYNKAGAYGIPQLKNKKVQYLSAHEQVQWGLRYIKHRYDNPCRAWKYWKRHGNY